MNTIDYASAGVNITNGDEASKKAYQNAKTTFLSRKGLLGEPFEMNGGFAGALDMGDYLLIQNDDGTGTKTEIAEHLGKYDTIGEDLLCMVADDAICVGAETISITNTIDVPHVYPDIIQKMTAGLAQACQKQKIVIPGGEIAELGNAVNKIVWNATAVGIVQKDKFITGENITPGQKIIGLKDPCLRSNGFSLARKVCETHLGENWYNVEWKDGLSWGEALLTPSKIFHRLVLDSVIGDFHSPRLFDVSGIVHITGGGIPGNLSRIFHTPSLGAKLMNLHDPHPIIKDLQRLGNIDESECYRTWHCGTAMMIICQEKDAEKICTSLNNTDNKCEAQIVGDITNTGNIELQSRFSTKLISF